MIAIDLNLNEVIANITHDLNEITYENQVMRAVAQTMVTVVHDRIHEQGKDANDSQIGTYTNSYMAVRTGNYKNADKTKKGKLKNAGKFTDASNKVGTDRPRYNRTSDTKVILSLTRQMENDFSVIAIDNGYGLGYKNEENYKKSQWAEANYNKPIFSLTEQEEKQVVEIAEFEVKRLTNG